MATDGNLLKFRKRNSQIRVDMPIDGYGQRTENREQALRKNEPGSLAIFEDIREGYFEADLGGNIVFANEPLCRIAGYSKDRLLGMDNRECTDSETAKRMYALFSRIYKTGMPVKVKDFQVIRKDGTKLTLEISASLIRNAEGQPAGFRGIALDVTERKQIEESLLETEKRYRSLFEESLDAIVITDRKGRFVDANKAALDLFGVYREETAKINFKEFYTDPKDGIRFEQEIEAKGSLQDFEMNLKKRDGTVMTCRLFVTAKRENGGGLVGYQGVIRDITNRRATGSTLSTRRVGSRSASGSSETGKLTLPVTTIGSPQVSSAE